MNRRAIIASSSAVIAASAILLFGPWGCSKGDPPSTPGPATVTVINLSGPESLMPLATAWAEACKRGNLPFQIVATPGAGPTGIPALKKKTAQLALGTHEIKPMERMEVMTGTGENAMDHHFGYDALTVFTHPSNPVREISVEELAGIWSGGGTVAKWEDLNSGFTGDIVPLGQPASSPLYLEFRERILNTAGQRSYRKGIREVTGGAAAAEAVRGNAAAIGYGSASDKPAGVNVLKISKAKGEPAVEPNAEGARSLTYPGAIKLYLYTAGAAKGELKAFIDWCLGPEGQAIVAKAGFVPLRGE
jgi:phosphate transport system substrate-binding protein